MSQFFSPLAWTLLLIAFATATAADESTPTEIKLRKDVVYGNADGVELKMHLAMPEQESDTLCPAILFLHRGGWVSGSKDRYLDTIQEFASHGYVVASVGYRFAPAHPFPAQVEDAKCAVRYIRAHAKELGVDANRIGAIGESAGAHLSMMLGTLDPEDGMEGEGGWHDQSSKVQAVVSFYGPVDLRWDVINDSPYVQHFERALAKRLLKSFVGGDPESKRETLFKASPIKYVDKRDVPMLLIHGTSDPLVLPDQPLIMAQALTAAGVEGRAEFIFGKAHDWDGEDFSKPLIRARRFLDEQLKVSSEDQRNDQSSATPRNWNMQLAAAALDKRATEWNQWKRAQRSEATTCISCHTALPYLLARGGLSRSLAKTESIDVRDELIADIRTRVQNRKKIEPWYAFSPQKSAESIGTEAVISSLLLCIQDAESESRELSESTREALTWMWSTQNASGPDQGAWPWLDFKLEPWESKSAGFWGASMAAIAVGIAPEGYANEPEIQEHISLLREYLRNDWSTQPIHHQATLLVASTRLGGLIDSDDQAAIAKLLVETQRDDGSWSLSDLGQWEHETNDSDAYATGLITYVLSQYRPNAHLNSITKARRWLIENQDPDSGSWNATSINKKRSADTFVGKFMQDAATAYAVMALQATE